MKRRRTPQEKKANEYTKDHVVIVDSVHGFRRSWPRKKARANRAYRKHIRQRLSVLEPQQYEDAPERIRPETVRRENVSKMFGVKPMGEVIRRRREQRIERTALDFWKWNRPYDRNEDRERFLAFLNALVLGRTENSRELAKYFRSLMDPMSRYPRVHDQYWWEKKQQWLRSFFRDEPEWEERVRAWIASFDE